MTMSAQATTSKKLEYTKKIMPGLQESIQEKDRLFEKGVVCYFRESVRVDRMDGDDDNQLIFGQSILQNCCRAFYACPYLGTRRITCFELAKQRRRLWRFTTGG